MKGLTLAAALLALGGCATLCSYDVKTVLQMQEDNAKRPRGAPMRSLADYPETCRTVAITPWNDVGRPGSPTAPIFVTPTQ